MLANIGRASAQGRARGIGALITEPFARDVLESSLREKGWVLGQNLQIEYRVTRGDTDLSQTYARELVALQPEVISHPPIHLWLHYMPNVLTFPLSSRWSAIQWECITLRASQSPGATSPALRHLNRPSAVNGFR